MTTCLCAAKKHASQCRSTSPVNMRKNWFCSGTAVWKLTAPLKTMRMLRDNMCITKVHIVELHATGCNSRSQLHVGPPSVGFHMRTVAGRRGNGEKKLNKVGSNIHKCKPHKRSSILPAIACHAKSDNQYFGQTIDWPAAVPHTWRVRGT